VTNVARLVTCLTTTPMSLSRSCNLRPCIVFPFLIYQWQSWQPHRVERRQYLYMIDCCYKTSHSFVKDSWNVVPPEKDKPWVALPFPQLHCHFTDTAFLSKQNVYHFIHLYKQNKISDCHKIKLTSHFTEPDGSQLCMSLALDPILYLMNPIQTLEYYLRSILILSFHISLSFAS
jgi:hypothetical protein